MSSCHHDLDDHQTATNGKRLLLALVVIAVFMVVEFIGGILSGSLALVADAAHMLTDAAALGLAACAQFFALRPADSKLHFGYRRAQVLAAFVNGILMMVLLGWIVFEAVTRFLNPVDINSSLMLWVAIIGLLANIVAFFILHRGENGDVNMRGALLHVVGDLFGSAAAIIAAIVISFTGWTQIDPLLSILVAVLIGISAFRLLRETSLILLEGAPENVSVEALSDGLKKACPLIKDVHHVRIWQITQGNPRITLHICVDQAEDAETALKAAKAYVSENFQLHKSTVQVDFGDTCIDEILEEENSTMRMSPVHGESKRTGFSHSSSALAVSLK